MNYQPVTAGNQTNPSAGFQEKFDAEKVGEESDQQYVLFPVWSSGSTNPQNNDGDAAFDEKEPDFDAKKPESEVNVSPSSSAQSRKQDDKTKKEAKGKSPVESFIGYRDLSAEFEDCFDNSINKVNAADASQLPDDPDMPELEDITYSDDEDDVGAEADFNNLETSIIVSPILTIRVHKDHPVSQIIGDLSSTTQTRSMTRVVKDQGYIKLLKIQVGLKLCRKNFFNSRCRRKKSTQEDGIDYEEVFAPVARIEAIRLFLAYASFMGFMVYQMDVNSAFLYGTIEEEVYVYQPLGFEDPDHPDKVYKVVKALYGLHQAPRAWQKEDILLVQIYVDDIIFGATNKDLCKSFEKLMKDKFQMSSMGELTFFLGLQVKQKKDGIFISHDKYVAEILRKFGLTEGKSANTPIDIEKPLLKDPDGEDVDVHTYRSMIGSLMYLTSSRPDIMFAVYACAHFQVTPKTLHLHAVKRIFRYLKGKPHLGLWYPKDSPFDLMAYSDSDYDGASVDMKSTTGGCQFLGCRLIFWQCKKQIVVATSSTEAEYVAVASCCAQVLWIQNQLQDYGDSPLLGVNTPRCDEDRLELMELMIFLLPKDEKVRIGVNAVDLPVFAVRHMLLLLVQKLLLFSLTNWCCSPCAVSEGFHQIIDFLNGSSIKYALTVNPNIYVSCIKWFWTTVAVKRVNDVTRLQALVDKKKLVVTEATIREALYLDDAAGVDCLPNKEIFAELARMGYEKPSTKLSSQASKGFPGVKTPLFEGMLVGQQVDEEGDAYEHVKEVNAGDAAEGDVSAAHGEVPTVVEEPSIPSPTPLTLPPQPSKDIPSTSQVQQSPPQSPQRVETFDETMMDDESNQGRMIAKMDQDDDVVLKDDKEVADAVKDVAENVVTTAKIITEVVTGASEIVTAASEIITTAEAQVPVATLTAAPTRVAAAPSRRRKGVVIRDLQEESTTSTIIPVEIKSKDKGKGILVEEPKPLKKKQQIKQDKQYARELHAELNKNIDWDEVIDHVKIKAKRILSWYQALKRKPHTEGMSYDDIRPIFEAMFNSNMAFLLKTKEQIEEDENRALHKVIETPAERTAKRRKLDEEVEELKRHLQIVPNEDDNVYTEATPLARKVPVVDYQIIEMNNKPYYKIIKADDTHQLHTCSDLENEHGPTKVKGWKLLESCGVQILTFTSTQLILLVERKYPLTKFTLDQMLNAVRLEVEEESEVSLELSRFIRQQHQEGQHE
nr:putative ribonuclease H-like domain-containing protein [Tanacetum cinerariifolium]